MTSQISGWVVDANHPNGTPATVNVTVDGGATYSTSATANLQTSDLSTGNFGFSIPVPQAVRDGLPHTVTVKTPSGGWSASTNVLQTTWSSSSSTSFATCSFNPPTHNASAYLNGVQLTSPSTTIPITNEDSLYLVASATQPSVSSGGAETTVTTSSGVNLPDGTYDVAVNIGNEPDGLSFASQSQGQKQEKSPPTQVHAVSAPTYTISMREFIRANYIHGPTPCYRC